MRHPKIGHGRKPRMLFLGLGGHLVAGLWALIRNLVGGLSDLVFLRQPFANKSVP
jgi:hypothetical protein